MPSKLPTPSNNSTPPVVKTSGLSVTYPGQSHPAVADITFDIQPATINTLLGPNGSGKSTVIKAILNLVNYSGKIQVFGREVAEVYPQIGYVPQFTNFDASFPISVAEFVDLALVKTQHPAEWRRTRVRETLAEIDSTNIIDKPIAALSGGQLQRALLARALVHQPQLLVLDEPEAGIDVGAEQTFYEIIRRLVNDEHVTVIIASHELDVVYNYADRVICINRQLVCDGTPELALSKDVFEKLYGREIKLYKHR